MAGEWRKRWQRNLVPARQSRCPFLAVMASAGRAQRQALPHPCHHHSTSSSSSLRRSPQHLHVLLHLLHLAVLRVGPHHAAILQPKWTGKALPVPTVSQAACRCLNNCDSAQCYQQCPKLSCQADLKTNIGLWLTITVCSIQLAVWGYRLCLSVISHSPPIHPPFYTSPLAHPTLPLLCAFLYCCCCVYQRPIVFRSALIHPAVD